MIVLSALWSMGCIALPLYMVVTMWREGDPLPSAILAALGVPLGFLLGALPWAVMAEQASPDLEVLKRGEWTCTDHTTTYIMVGKVLAPTTRCIEYRRIA